MKKFATAFLMAFATILIAGADASAQDITCTGTIGAVQASTVTVPPGASCVLIGTLVSGDIKVQQGASLDARNVRVDGSVQADFANRVQIRNGSQIQGDVQIKNGVSGIVTRAVVVGNVEFEGNRGNLTVSFSDIEGELKVSKNFGVVNILSNININDNILVEENGRRVTVQDNRTDGDIQLSKNRGGVEAFDNFIVGNLQCVENRPFQREANNTVGGTNQCPNF